MKKIFSLMLVFVLIGCTFAGCGTKKAETDLDYIKNKGELVIGVTEYKPINYKDENGNWTGFDTEFAEAFAKKIGVKPKFVVVDWDNKYTELSSKAIDCVWNGMTITDEGKLNASISNPYLYNAQVVIMAKDKVEKYADAASMKDLKFAVEVGSAGSKAAKDAGYTKITEVAAQSDALLEVASGSADACVVDITMATAMTGEKGSYSNLGYKVKLTEEEYGIASRKDSNLNDELNRVMAELNADGTLDALAKKYNLTLVK